MMDIKSMRKEMEAELIGNILPFWMNRKKDEVNGGFYGRITGTGVLMPEAEKGAILNARILWTFSAAYRLLRNEEYLTIATRAKRIIIRFKFFLCPAFINCSLDSFFQLLLFIRVF